MAGVNEVTEGLEATDDADFNAGFEQSATETPHTPEPVEEVAPVVESPKYAQITESQFQDLMNRAATVDEMKASLDKSFGTAFGKIGGIERVLNQIQSSGGQAVEVTSEDFAELRQEFPELAELQAKGLNKVLSKLKGPGNSDAIEKMVADRVAEFRQQTIDASLDAIVDGDWMAEVKSDRYKNWIGTQAQEVQALADSNALRDASRLMRLFAASKTAPSAKPISSRKQQLEAAISPKGAGGPAISPTGDDDFSSGFQTGRV